MFGFRVGYWTHEAEDWFQSRLDEIRNGEGRPLRATTWKKVIEGNRRLATRFMLYAEKQV